jgi:hypothetical protein
LQCLPVDNAHRGGTGNITPADKIPGPAGLPKPKKVLKNAQRTGPWLDRFYNKMSCRTRKRDETMTGKISHGVRRAGKKRSILNWRRGGYWIYKKNSGLVTNVTRPLGVFRWRLNRSVFLSQAVCCLIRS